MWLIIRVYSRIPQNSRKKYFCRLNIQKCSSHFIIIIFFHIENYRSSKIKMFGNEDFCQWQFTPPGKLLESRFPLSSASDFWHFYNNFMGSCFFVVGWLKKRELFPVSSHHFMAPAIYLVQSESMDLLYKKISEMGWGGWEGNR